MNPATHHLTTCPMCGCAVEKVRCFVRFTRFDGEQVEREIFANCKCLCDSCSDIHDQNEAAAKGEKARERTWMTMLNERMPSDYQRATSDRISRVYSPALGWDQTRAKGGIGLIGEANSGKSCAMACLIMRRKLPFLWWSGTEARDAAIDAQSADRAERADCRARWEHAMRVPLLVLDDVSQGKMTEGWSACLFDLLETRLSRSRPVLWTSQIGLGELKAKIQRQNGGDDAQANAIARRLSQHSLVLMG
jgi:hypothetical protein